MEKGWVGHAFICTPRLELYLAEAYLTRYTHKNANEVSSKQIESIVAKDTRMDGGTEK